MCGIVGAAGWLGKNEKKALCDLLIMDQLRGFHSVGIGYVHKIDGNYGYIKNTVNPANFVNDKSFVENVNKSNIVIGHNRWATQGAVNAKNAHPFMHDKILGVHNGTLINQNLLPESHKFEVDSNNIIYSINKIGIGETHKRLDGAYALVWYNADDQTLNFVRNSQRPMYILTSNDGQTIFWASEKYMLFAGIDRQKYLKYDFDKVEELPVHEHWKYKIPDKCVKIPEPEKNKLEPYRYKFQWNDKGKKSERASKGSLLSSLGLSQHDRVEFIPTSVCGKAIDGVLIDEFQIPVRMWCATPEEAEEMFDKSDHYVEADIVTTYEPGGYAPKGKIICDAKGAELVPYSTLNNNNNIVPFKKKGEDDSERNTIEGYNGETLTQEQFDQQYFSCGWCFDPLDFNDENKTFIDDKICLCGSCSKEELAVEYYNS